MNCFTVSRSNDKSRTSTDESPSYELLLVRTTTPSEIVVAVSQWLGFTSGESDSVSLLLPWLEGEVRRGWVWTRSFLYWTVFSLSILEIILSSWASIRACSVSSGLAWEWSWSGCWRGFFLRFRRSLILPNDAISKLCDRQSILGTPHSLLQAWLIMIRLCASPHFVSNISMTHSWSLLRSARANS